MSRRAWRSPVCVALALALALGGCATPRIASGQILDQHDVGIAGAEVRVRTTALGLNLGPAPGAILSPIPRLFADHETGHITTTSGPDGHWRVALPYTSSVDHYLATLPPGTFRLSDTLWQILGHPVGDELERLWRIPPEGPQQLWKNRWDSAELPPDGWWYPLHFSAVPGAQPDAAAHFIPPTTIELHVLHGGLAMTEEPFPVEAPEDGYVTTLTFTVGSHKQYYWRRPGAVLRHGVIRLIIDLFPDQHRGRASVDGYLRCDAGRRVDHPPLGQGGDAGILIVPGGPAD